MDATAHLDPAIAALAKRIDAALPQTQCTRCGYPACRPYADAVAAGEAINRCAPGGAAGIAALARITARPALPLDPAHGTEGPLAVAHIDEAACIGCALCRDACPVDAIAGGPKRMHTVLAAWCTGCALCLPPCPVDCIVLRPAGRDWSPADAQAARARHARHAQAQRATAIAPPDAAPALDARAAREAAVAAALERARARRAGRVSTP